MNKRMQHLSHRQIPGLMFYFVVLIFLASCKKNSDSSHAACNLTSFPSVAGNSWTYKVTTRLYLSPLPDSTVYDTLYMVVVKDTLYNGMTMQKIEAYSNENPYRSFIICMNTSTSFVAYLTEPGWISYLLKGNNNAGSNNVFNDNKTEIDSTLTTILNFQANKWIYRENSWVKMEKVNAGQETVTTPKGTFNCCKYNTNYLRKFFTQDIDITEFFSEKGLIKKITNDYDIDFVDGVGNPIGHGDRRQTIELIDYILH